MVQIHSFLTNCTTSMQVIVILTLSGLCPFPFEFLGKMRVHVSVFKMIYPLSSWWPTLWYASCHLCPHFVSKAVLSSSYSTDSSRKNKITWGVHRVTQELNRCEIRMELSEWVVDRVQCMWSQRKWEELFHFYRPLLFLKQQNITKVSPRSYYFV